MNYLILIIVALTFVPIVFGILLGLLRGSRRALLRLILVILSAALALALCGTVANTTVTVDVSGFTGGEEPMTVADYLQQMIGDALASLGNFMMPIIQSIVKLLLFLVLFGLFLFISWILVYPICKLFVKPRRVQDANGNVRKKRHRLLGAVFGLVQGVVVALCVCIVVNGFFVQGNVLFQAMDGLAEATENVPGDEGEPSEIAMLIEEEGGSEGEAENGGEGVDQGNGEGEAMANMENVKAMFEEYNQSALGKMYSAIGSKPFALLSRVKTENGTITLPGQVEALGGLADIAKELTNLLGLNFENFYADDNIAKLTATLNRVDEIKNGLSEEAKTSINGLMSSLGDSLGINVDLLNRFTEIDFAKEAQAFAKLGAYKDKDFSKMSEEEITEAAKDIVSSLAESELMLDVLAQQGAADLGSGLDAEQRDKIDEALDAMVADGSISQEKMDRLRDLFNLKDDGGSAE